MYDALRIMIAAGFIVRNTVLGLCVYGALIHSVISVDNYYQVKKDQEKTKNQLHKYSFIKMTPCTMLQMCTYVYVLTEIYTVNPTPSRSHTSRFKHLKNSEEDS